MLLKTIARIAFLSYLSFLNVYGQEINVTYNYSSVKKLIEILDKGELLENDFDELMSLNGSKAYLKKMATFFSGVDELSFKRSLDAAAKGNPLENDLFMFERVINSVPEAKKLLAAVAKKEEELTQNSTALLKNYSPSDIKIDVTVYMILGIIGGGWTFDDSKNSFYLDFSLLKEDINGLTYLAAHELYHLIQYRFMKTTPDKTEKVSFLLDQMVREGSATYVADFTKLTASGYYVDFSKKDYARNFRRMESNFALFETLIYKAHHDPQSNLDLLYNIGLSGMYQSPLYFVGYHMIDLIEKYNGRQELINLLKESPDKLVLAYDQLFTEGKNLDEKYIPLSKATIEIIKSLYK
nr:DUF5700 domain-containing putative Zn-dependent protease [uncultured Allomuricauda sp.]